MKTLEFGQPVDTADAPHTTQRLGAEYLGEGRCRFLVWAPYADRVEVILLSPREAVVPLTATERGYFYGTVEDVAPESRYRYRLHTERDGEEIRERPDPASRFQPDGVHESSRIVSTDFRWTDGGWAGIPLARYIICELHVGTFTPEGTFEAIIPQLDRLIEAGYTALELMPVVQFPGDRNWGYDGVYPFAVHDAYGGPGGLKRLVDACHGKGLSVILDVVYNHLGPEGNYLRDFGPYFTDFYQTPWGDAVNFDGPRSDEVRRYFIENALYWTVDCHIDALRIDAVHAILDFSARPFLEELGAAVRRAGEAHNRRIHCIAESDLNDTRVIRPRSLGGFGLDGQWNDDFHHALHALVTGEREGYYRDFGTIGELARSWTEGYAYGGRYSAYRRRRHGNSSRNIPARRFVVFAQNHDQIGNRLKGDRLSSRLSLAELKLTAGCVLLSPFIPLLFMGEEYGETAPFPYFVSHTDPDLVAAVREGRRREFAAFGWDETPPDPQAEETFRSAVIDPGRRREGNARVLYEFHQALIRLRKEIPALSRLSKKRTRVALDEKERLFFAHRRDGESEVCIAFHFDGAERTAALPFPRGRWHRRLDAGEVRWGGAGTAAPDRIETDGGAEVRLSPHAVLLYEKEIPDCPVLETERTHP